MIGALPAAAAALTVAGYLPLLFQRRLYAPQAGQYAIVSPAQGAVIATPPSYSSVSLSDGQMGLDCGGAFYTRVVSGYQVTQPPIGTMVESLPDSAQDRNVGGAIYFAFGGAYYRPIFSGSAISCEVVATPSRISRIRAAHKHAARCFPISTNDGSLGFHEDGAPSAVQTASTASQQTRMACDFLYR